MYKSRPWTQRLSNGAYVLAAAPALGAYPDSLINTPAAFPGESPSATPVGATGAIASPPPAAKSAVPIDTLNGADFGKAPFSGLIVLLLTFPMA